MAFIILIDNKLIIQSMFRKGNYWDNPEAENIFKILKAGPPFRRLMSHEMRMICRF
jgi:hypothetical protein